MYYNCCMASRPPLNIRLSDEETLEVQRVAEMYGTSKSAIIRMCLEMFLQELKDRPTLDISAIVRKFEKERGNPDFQTGSNPALKPNRGRAPFSEVFHGSRVAEDPAHPLPCLGRIAAGSPTLAIDDTSRDTVLAPKQWPAKYYCLRVSGQSMEPDYPDGSFVVIRPLAHGEYPIKNHVYAWLIDGGTVTLKRLVYTKAGNKNPDGSPRKPIPHLVSINPAFPDVVPLNETRAIGEAVYCFSP
jgi:SOS-response transcriptional repressor LexA